MIRRSRIETLPKTSAASRETANRKPKGEHPMNREKLLNVLIAVSALILAASVGYWIGWAVATLA